MESDLPALMSMEHAIPIVLDDVIGLGKPGLGKP